jgi:hypothetical protein
MHPNFIESIAKEGYWRFRQAHGDLPLWDNLPEETRVRWRGAVPDVYRSLGQNPANAQERYIAEAMTAREGVWSDN